MSDYVTLLGAEDVRSASRNMQSAAEEMQRASANMEQALLQHQRFLTDWLQTLEQVLVENRKC